MSTLRLMLALAVAVGGFADTITLKSGRVIEGTYLGGTARQVRVDVGDQVRTFDVSDIVRIEFGGSDQAPPARPAASDDGRPTLRRADNASQPAPDPSDDGRPILRRAGNVMQPAPDDSAAQAATIELPAGTNVVVRMIDGVDSDVNRVGQTFAASIDEPVMINGAPAIPRGADVVIRLVDASQSGRLTGSAEVTLRLVSVKVNGRPVDINSQSVSRQSDSRGQQSAKVAGGGAALGAVLGTIAGGGKGAVGGAIAGGAVGTGAAAVLKGQRVKVPSETRLTFILETAVKI